MILLYRVEFDLYIAGINLYKTKFKLYICIYIGV